MKPMYFPFTCIREQNACAVFRRLGPFCLCRENEEDSFCNAVDSAGASYIEYVYPVADGSGRVAALAKEYLKWGNLHKGGMAMLSRLGKGQFYNNEFSANISTLIKKSDNGESDANDPVFMARLFLALARRFDTREDEVLHEIEVADVAGRSLVAELTGKPLEDTSTANFFSNSSPPGDSGGVATQMRLSSFFRLLCRQKQIPRLYVTSSPAVMESLVDRFSGISLLFRLENVQESVDGLESGAQAQPDWIAKLVNLASVHDNAADLHDAVPGPFGGPGSEDGYHMDVYAVDACPPTTFVNELAGMPCQGLNDTDSAGLTLVSLISD
ncbi:MAG: hypothetical protein GXP53_10130 [Deltaproteobacteria bacterium]|nr:hypothetical protein [Deltaproteobacteria bacterium]